MVEFSPAHYFTSETKDNRDTTGKNAFHLGRDLSNGATICGLQGIFTRGELERILGAMDAQNPFPFDIGKAK